MSQKKSSDLSRPTLQPSELGNYIKYDTCPQYFKFGVQRTGFEDLNHDKTNYLEAFAGGNIIEKRIGNEFEDDVTENITGEVTEVYDIDELTLGMVARGFPDKVTKILDAESKRGAIKTGYFTVNGIHADELKLKNVDEITDTEKEPEQATLSETPDIKIAKNNTKIEAQLFSLRIFYTEQLFEAIFNNIREYPTGNKIPFEVPEVTTGSTDPKQKSTRDITDPIVIYQPAFTVTIGAWTFNGAADIVLIWPVTDPAEQPDVDSNIQARIRIIDAKLATEEQANHQIQTVTYSHAIDDLDCIPSDNVRIETGVLTQHDSYLPPTPTSMPEFDRESRETALQRLTKPGGKLDRVFKQVEDDNEDVSYQLDSKCSSCQFNEICYSESVENAGIELLGISRGIQDKMREEGIETLNDLAKLAQQPDNYMISRKAEKPDKVSKYADTYDTLASIPGLGGKLPELIQRSQALLEKINPSHRRVDGGYSWVRPYTNTDYGDIPDDTNLGTDDYKEGSMIRVYLNVQYDHIRDAISAIGFHIIAAASSAERRSHAFVDTDLPDDPVGIREKELELLTEFSKTVLDEIERIGRGIRLNGYEQEHPFLHFFTYTEDEKKILQEKLGLYTTKKITEHESLHDEYGNKLLSSDELETHPDLDNVRGILSKQKEGKEKMITAISPDISRRVAVPRPTTGLVNIYKNFFPERDERKDERFSASSWTYRPSDLSRAPPDEMEIDLTDAFSYRLFNNAHPYVEKSDGIELLIDSYDYNRSQGEYEARVRTGAQIPLPYLWAAGERITEEWIEEQQEHDSDYVINAYRYHGSTPDDPNPEEPPVKTSPEDIEALLKRMCECLRHVEQGVPSRNRIRR